MKIKRLTPLRFLVAVALLSACISTSTQAAAQPSSSRTIAQAGKAIDAAHAAGDFDGVVVIAQNGKVLMAKAVGFSNRERKRPFGTDTVFRLASLTKQVTALLVMQQVAAGTLKLNESAGRILPALSATTGRVTVQQLLQHISGLPNPSDGPDNDIPAFYTRTNVGPGYTQSTATGFCSGTPKRDQINAYTEDGSPEPLQNPGTYAAAGALFGNALDVAKWNDALMTNKLLPKAQTDIMFHGENNLGGEALGSWSYDVPGFTPALHVIERQGDIGGVRILNLLIPAEQASIVILANTGRADLFNTYSKQGLGYALLQSVYSPLTAIPKP